MRNGWRNAFVMGLEVVAISLGIAQAEVGWITFSGAVVNPTCDVAAPGSPGAESAAPAHGSCNDPAGTRRSRVVASDPAAFERAVVRLTDHEQVPLLAKFSNEAAAASPKGEHPLLVVQTYE